MRSRGEVEYTEVLEQWANKENRTLANLKEGRAPLLNQLPTDTQWFKVAISKSDLKNLQVINEFASWSILSSFKGSIPLVAKNLEIFTANPPNLPNIPIDVTRTVPTYFRQLLYDLNRFRVQAGAAEHNLTLTIIASSLRGPYTILDGNHTAVALYLRHYKDHPEIPLQSFNSYLGISVNMPSCQWYHINSY